MTELDDTSELKKRQEESQKIRYRYYKKHRSRLDRYKGELLTLHRAGTTCKDLQGWLREQRINVDISTVRRWLSKNG